MPEDLPVRKCTNVMVGIIRSEVIFNTLMVGFQMVGGSSHLAME
jgi:hypothetical protein